LGLGLSEQFVERMILVLEEVEVGLGQGVKMGKGIVGIAVLVALVVVVVVAAVVVVVVVAAVVVVVVVRIGLHLVSAV